MSVDLLFHHFTADFLTFSCTVFSNLYIILKSAWLLIVILTGHKWSNEVEFSHNGPCSLNAESYVFICDETILSVCWTDISWGFCRSSPAGRTSTECRQVTWRLSSDQTCCGLRTTDRTSLSMFFTLSLCCFFLLTAY